MLSFANATGNLFNLLGRLGGIIANLNSYQTSQKTILIDTTTGLEAQLKNEPDVQAIMGDNWIALLASVNGSWGSVSQQIAEAYLNRLIFRDNPQLNQTLTTFNTQTSISELIRQMSLAGATVLAMAVSGSVVSAVGTPGPHFTGTGNGIISVGVKRPQDGRFQENLFAEKVTFTCSSDSYTGRGVAGNEGFRVTGTGSEVDYFAFDWPLGSNCALNLSAIDGSASNSAGNLLTNSGFDTFTVANTPDDFTIDVGAAGTQIFSESSITYGSGSALRILGDGSNLTQISQAFGDSAGTSGTLSPATQYSFNVFLRRGAVAPSGGVLEFSLWNGDTDQILKDNAGNNNSTSVTLSGLTTSYAPTTVMFRTPTIMPSSYLYRIRLTTALTSGTSIYLDRGSLGAATRAYASGPYLAVHSGSVPFQVGDYGYASFTNSRGTAGTLATFQTLFSRLFASLVYPNEILLPSSSSPSLSDALIA